MSISLNWKRSKKAKERSIHEQTSPLFRIISVFNYNDPQRKSFGNNICAFHVGKGYILSVAHNLRTEAGAPPSIQEPEYQRLRSNLPGNIRSIFDSSYNFNRQTNKRYLNSPINKQILEQMNNALRTANYDTRWITLYQQDICKPFLILQFRDDLFYQDQTLTEEINSNHRFQELKLFRYTFMLELELVETFYNEDYALYRIINNNQLIKKIPSFDINYNILDSKAKIFCLQSAPLGEIGRLLNTAEIEGLLDHWSLFPDRIDGNYPMEGFRYLIKGYFRFGSSGAPYLKYDHLARKFKVNAIQSQASPIQLTINNNRNGNFQYINAIASPIKNIEKNLKKIINN